MDKCLVTGAAGFISSHLVEKLVSSGFYVVPKPISPPLRILKKQGSI